MADDNANAPVATEESSEVTKPEYVQDKFWNAESNQVNIENLASSYNSLEAKLGSRTEDLTKQIRTDLEAEKLKNVPESYKLNVPEMDNTKLTINEDMPIVQWWGKTAKDAGLSQEQYDDGVKAFVNNAVANLPNPELEKQKLGDAGKERVEAASMWSKKHLSQEGFNTIQDLASTADGVKVVEELMKLTKDSTMPSSNTAIDAQATQDDLKAMLNDPRYWDSNKRDPGYVRRVTELYEKAYKGQ
ncbi:putative capsid assembly protein [uncultured Mediterranean phage uvMED]|nr:putative capsid assembly protein [uncultured Mediterranean phage uvMED]BAQ87805.1 putative capsid assembly protein [uncultured Mediterranean phage uvMED]|tara:strand:- start:379 stop:1113 length:735 start_codon:yes stop_codon:yes gene_type:complete